MVKIWSELPGARSREVLADVATAAWVFFWGSLALGLYSFLIGFVEAGRLVRGGGESLQAAGLRLGDTLGGLPLIGAGMSDAVRGGFEGAGAPIVAAGGEIETFVALVAVVLALVLLAVPLVPWLTRYVPWRLERLRRVRAAHRAIRRAPAGVRETATPTEIERLLAGRAIHRLEWTTLLEFTPDPIGDWQAGRFDRLARAEYEQAGLRSAG